MRILSVVGNRPQFIKSAPLSLALRDAGIDEVVLHTGQHWDAALSGIFFDELGLGAPRYRLDLHTADATAMTPGIRAAIEAEQPNWVLVYGDTNSTLAGAEAAGETPVAHVEAGLRSFDLTMPEERNRIAVDRLAALLLCPDERSSEQLAREGVSGRRVVVGDVMADATRRFAPLARERSGILGELGLEPAGYAVATVHREANVTQPERLRHIVDGLLRVEGPVVFPAHPRTRAAIEQLGLEIPLIEPLGYLDFAALASQARVVLTDSGGLQKEAYWYRVPCVTMRANTEWVDTVATGANILVDDDPESIAAAAAARIPDSAPELYGDGHAAERVAAALYP
jgi:UDP-GlcNAc3NAcA epimerase